MRRGYPAGMNPPTQPPTLFVLAGPNGSGKTTVADFLLGQGTLSRYSNADVIAKGLRQGGPEVSNIEAGRIMLAGLHEAIARRESVSFETTLSGLSWQNLFEQAHKRGFEIVIAFVAVESADLACKRVAQRVKEGGHSIPEADVRRRFSRSLGHFFTEYSLVADCWYFFDNSGASAVLLAYKENGKGLQIKDTDRFKYFQELR